MHIVAVTAAGAVVVCRSAEGWRFLPGGTREPGESLAGLARRELREEAGARMTGELALFSAFVADSTRDRPYRPHQPHPRAWWAFGVVPVELDGPPANPPDGETVVEVLTLPPAEAATWLDGGSDGDPAHAGVVRHAVELGLLGPDGLRDAHPGER